jgi:hypothetical protein
MDEHEKLSIAIQALKDIVDPISALRRDIKDDEVLNGCLAISLSNDQSHLKNIAKEALLKIK